MSIGAAIAVGAVTGLALGIVVSLATDVPLAPELGLAARSAGRLAPSARGHVAPGMATSESTNLEAGGRDLRVSSADRVIFPETERSAAITKLDVVKYYLAVEDGIMRALDRRPTTLERWPKGVHPGIVLSTREKGGGDAFFQKRVPRGAPDYLETARIEFPSGRHADEICPTEIAVVGWAAQMGTITFHPWPVRREDVDHPDELRLDLDPQPGTDFADAVRVAAEARVLLGDLGYVGFPKTSGGRGVHIYVRIEPRWTFTDVRHAAIAFGRELERRLPGQVTTKWWKEERGERIFVDYNQNARDRTIASAYSVRPKPGAPVSAPVTWDELAEVSPEDFTVATMPARFAELGDRHAAIDEVAHSLDPLLEMYERDEAEGEGDMPYPPDYPKMPGEPKRVQPSRDRDRKKDDSADVGGSAHSKVLVHEPPPILPAPLECAPEAKSRRGGLSRNVDVGDLRSADHLDHLRVLHEQADEVVPVRFAVDHRRRQEVSHRGGRFAVVLLPRLAGVGNHVGAEFGAASRGYLHQVVVQHPPAYLGLARCLVRTGESPQPAMAAATTEATMTHLGMRLPSVVARRGMRNWRTRLPRRVRRE